jgi:hypothetical protein
MVSLVNSHTNATSKRRHLREVDLRFPLNSTPGWQKGTVSLEDIFAGLTVEYGPLIKSQLASHDSLKGLVWYDFGHVKFESTNQRNPRTTSCGDPLWCITSNSGQMLLKVSTTN